MRTCHVVALSMLAGIVLGAVAIQGLHAQTKPPAYVVIAIRNVTDPDGLKAVMEKTAPGALAAAGGRYVIRTSDITSLNGTPPSASSSSPSTASKKPRLGTIRRLRKRPTRCASNQRTRCRSWSRGWQISVRTKILPNHERS
jgi:hypothetical protein